MYHIGKIPPMYIRYICSWKPTRYCSAWSVQKPKLILRLWFTNTNSLSCSLWCVTFRL